MAILRMSLLLLVLPAIGGAATFAQQPVPTTQPPPYVAVEQEVIENVLNQRIGDHTVADLDLPRDFVEIVADRIIRESFEQRYRVVVADGANAANSVAPPRTTTRPAETAPFAVKRNPGLEDPQEPGRWREFGEIRPPLPGFRASLDRREFSISRFEPAADATDDEKHAARLIASTLARDGLLTATAHAIAALGPDQFGKDRETDIRRLQDVGLPADILQYFIDPSTSKPIDPGWIAALLRESPRVDQRFARNSAQFRFTQTYNGFEIRAEDGQTYSRSMRLQITRGDMWIGPGDGSSVDILRQVTSTMTETPLTIHVEDRFLGTLIDTMQGWNIWNPQRVLLLSEAMTVSQWAADNAKSGSAAAPGKRHREFVTVVPRYAGRGEDGAVFVPGDTRLSASLAVAGRRIASSPLLFEGGNLLAFRNARQSDLILLVGEAEIHRNVALGLSPQQAAEALRVEFGADRIEILPAASFHIDYEVSLRASERRTIAFVNDTQAACREIVRIGIDALQRGGQLSASDAHQALERLQAGQTDRFYELVAPAIGKCAMRPGQFAESAIATFAASAVDSAVGNFQRFLFAIDFELAIAELPQEASADGHTQAYFRSLRRLEARQRALQARLESIGLTLVRLPSLSADRLSVNYVNAVQTYSHMLVPAYGGLFAPMDAAAEQIVRQTLGSDIRVAAILTGESQRRGGALHCSIGLE